MVSYPDSHDRALAVRRPPSVASSRASSTTVRRHRHGRSHHGGSSSSSYQPQNEFPCFTHTGDVEILIRTPRREQRYLLHRLILAQCSGFFEAGTSAEWARGGEANGAGGAQEQMARIPEAGPLAVVGVNKKRWRYELDWGGESETGEVPMLVQKESSQSIFGGEPYQPPPPVRNKPPASQSSFFRSMANLSALNVQQQPPLDDPAEELLRDYDNLLRIFYNYPPALDGNNIAVAYVECKSLLHLADMYDALEVVGPRVDHHLLRFQGRLFKQIAKYPPSYLKLGYLARSRAIFAEALVHVVGQWPLGANQLRGQVQPRVMDLIEDKVDDLEELKAKVEGRLFRVTLTTPRGERVSPLNAWTDWLAVSLFRQWLAEKTTPPPAPILKVPGSRGGAPGTNAPNSRASSSHSRHGPPPPTSRPGGPPPPQPSAAAPPPHNTGRVFRLIGAGGAGYLTHDEVKRFLKAAPGEAYSREALKRLERRVEEVKNLAREAVRPLMREFLELDVGARDAGGGGAGGGLPYLTCTRCDEGDFPWEE